MPGDTAAPVQAHPLHYRDFRLFLTMRCCTNLAQMMQTVAVGWTVYDLTQRPMDLGYVGLALFLPQVLLVLLSGHVADLVDRRRIMLTCLSVQALCAAALFALCVQGNRSVAPIYAVLLVFGAARAFLGPAMQSLLPLLVPGPVLPRAVAWNSSTWQMGVIAGPALGGLLYGLGSQVVFATVAVGFLAAAAATAGIASRLRTAAAAAEPILDRLLAGVRFVFSRPIVLGAISLDLFAVLFGGATALLPVYARDILHVGAAGLGLLRCAPAVGAAACGLWLARRPLQKRAGLVMFACVAGFGLATVVFGLSENFVLSLAALAVLGACDVVSVVIRFSLVQFNTPDAMRGRVSAVNLLFVGTSNELGEFESGLTAAWLGTVPAVVLGGVGTLLVVALWAWRFKDLRRVDRLDGPAA